MLSRAEVIVTYLARSGQGSKRGKIREFLTNGCVVQW